MMSARRFAAGTRCSRPPRCRQPPAAVRKPTSSRRAPKTSATTTSSGATRSPTAFERRLVANPAHADAIADRGTAAAVQPRNSRRGARRIQRTAGRCARRAHAGHPAHRAARRHAARRRVLGPFTEGAFMTKDLNVESDPQTRAADHCSAFVRDPAVRPSGPHADRARRERLQGERREPEPDPRRHDHPARPVQEAPLAGGRADLLPAAPALRQALRGAERAGRSRSPNGSSCSAASASRWPPTSRRRRSSRAPPRGREEAPVQISRLLHAHEIVLSEARAMARLADEARRRRDQRPARQRRHPHERAAGLVRRRARRGRAGRHCGRN